MENITKENRLIAEFMGLRYGNGSIMTYVMENGIEFLPKDLKYHESWAWLMPVVLKIEEMGATVIIGRMFCEIDFQHPLDRAVKFNNRMVSGVKMNAIHAAIVNFIKFHNAINPSTLN